MAVAPQSVDADLWDMGINFEHVRKNNLMRPVRIANFLFSQKAGARIWREIGGWKAVSEEYHATVSLNDSLWKIGFAFSGAKGKGPQDTEAPIGYIEQRRKAESTKQFAISKAEQWQEIQAKRAEEDQARIDAWGDDWINTPTQKALIASDMKKRSALLFEKAQEPEQEQ